MEKQNITPHCILYFWKLSFVLTQSIKQRVAKYEIDKAHEQTLHKAGVSIYIECELIAKKYFMLIFFLFAKSFC